MRVRGCEGARKRVGEGGVSVWRGDMDRGADGVWGAWQWVWPHLG